MPRTDAAANAATMPSSSRRGLLKAGGALGTLAALAIPAAVLPKAEAAEPDPVFSAIAAVRSAQQERDRLCRQSHAEYIAGGISAPTDAQVMAACSVYAIALRRAVRTVPTTAGGLQDWLALMWAHNTWEDDIWEDEVRPILATVRAYHAREAVR